ncbi:MAG: Permease of the major facilitator superfamily [Phenylobacterium sp.]|nr:Permease of the major facilitator superfamily [Phenylobacterium sp.]
MGTHGNGQTMTGRSVLGAWYAVAILGSLYVVAFVDRLILGLLVEPLRADLHITDTQISLLMGVAFAAFYSFVGLPLGRVADLGNRKWLLVGTAVIWGSCTFGSGLATSFWVLCLLRIGVAIGEAALTPTSLSLISDLFPREQRARATSVFMSLGALGATGSYILGGLVVKAIGNVDHLVLPLLGSVKPWQAVFFLVGAPAFLFAAIIALTVKEPVRETAPSPAANGLTFAWARRPYVPAFLFFIATAIGQVMIYGLGGWAPTYLVRQFHWATGDAGIRIGLASMTCGVSGMLIAPRVAEIWSARGRRDAPVLVLAAGLLLGFPLVIAASLAPSGVAFLGFYAAAMFCIMGTGMMPFICVQWGIPSHLKGEFLAAGLLANSLVGIALGPTATVLAAKVFGGGAHLGQGLALVAAICGPLAAGFALLLRRPMARLLEAEAGAAARPVPQAPALSAVGEMI